MSNTAGVLQEAGTAYPWRAHEFSPIVLMWSMLLIFLYFCVVLLCVFTFVVPCCDVRYNFRIFKLRWVRLYRHLFVGRLMSYFVFCECLRIVMSNILSNQMSLHYMSHVVVSNTISTEKTIFESSLPPSVCMRVHVLFTLFVFSCVKWCSTHIVLCFLFGLTSSCVPNVASVSGLSILDCPFGFL